MRAALPRATGRATFGAAPVRLARFTARHLLSFEAALALFVYSNVLKSFLPDLPGDETLLFGLVAVAAGGVVVLRQGIYLRGLPLVVACLLFLGWAVLSLTWTPSKSNARSIVTFMLIFELPCVVLAALIVASSRERVLRLLAFVLAIGGGLALFGWFVHLLHGNIRFYRGFGAVQRAYYIWGYAIAEAAVVAFALLAASRTFSRQQLAAGALFAACASFLLVGTGRGPLLSVLFAILLAFAAGLPEITRQRIRVPVWQLIGVTLVLLGTVMVIYLMSSGVRLLTLTKLTQVLNQLDAAEDIAAQGGANRFVTYSAALAFWLQAPVFGNGIGSFSIMLLGVERPGALPHNMILEILCSLGLVGLGLFLVMLWVAGGLVAGGRLRRDPLLLAVAMLVAVAFTSAMFRGDLGSQERLFLWLGLLALRPPAVAAERPPAWRPAPRARRHPARARRSAPPQPGVDRKTTRGELGPAGQGGGQSLRQLAAQRALLGRQDQPLESLGQGSRVARRDQQEMPGRGLLGEHPDRAGDDRLGPAGGQGERPARIDLAIGKDQDVGGGEMSREIGLGQEPGIEGEAVLRSGCGHPGCERAQIHERPAGDDDVAVAAAPGELEPGRDQHVDPLIRLERAEQQDAERSRRARARGGCHRQGQRRVRQHRDALGRQAQALEMARRRRGVGDVVREAVQRPVVAEALQRRGGTVERHRVVRGEDDRHLPADPGIAHGIEQRQDQPLQVDDVRPLAADQGCERTQAQTMLETLAPAAGATLPLAAVVEQGQVREAGRGQGLPGTQRPADQRHLGPGRGERLAERRVVGQGEQRGVDNQDLHGATARGVLRGAARSARTSRASAPPAGPARARRARAGRRAAAAPPGDRARARRAGSGARRSAARRS